MSAAEVLYPNVGNPFPEGWTDDRLEFLRHSRARGESFGWIEKHIGGGLTRNAILGKAWRQRIPGPGIDASVQRVKVVRARRSNVAHAKGSRPAPTGYVEPIRLEVPKLHLLDLKDGACRFPIGDPRGPSFGFCGQPCPAEKPYCINHMAVAYRPAATTDDDPYDSLRRVR